MKVLLLVSGTAFQYRVLRCAAATGAEVFILGHTAARDLAMSRYCRQYLPAPCVISFANAAEIGTYINACSDELGIACVLPTDADTTRILTSLRGQLRLPTFPMPDLATFDTLNDKARFAEICEELGIPHPASRIAATSEQLRQLLQHGEIRLPSIAKPSTMYGGIGMLILQQDTAHESIDKIDYEPIVIQDFIDGDDISIALFCKRGAVVAEIVYRSTSGAFQFVSNGMLSECARKVVLHFAYDGVIGFDARLSRDGRSIALIECNPRFWFNMDFALVAGVNFVELGLENTPGRPTPSIDGAIVCTRKLLLLKVFMPWRLARQDLKMLSYCLADPIGFALSSLPAADVSIRTHNRAWFPPLTSWIRSTFGIPRKLTELISRRR